VDFAPGVDEILLSDDVFSGIAEGALAAAAFHTGSAATDANHHVIYDNVSGNLYFDADGTGAIEAQLFAILQPGLNLSAADFTVI
jgi:Ca2+-binding RTX toxin-like protein